MAKIKYIAMPNSKVSSGHVPIVGRELHRIQKKQGCIKPAMVVDAARPKENPLHAFFEWDDSVAAEEWRQDQARGLIRSVRVIQCDMPPQEQPIVRAFVSVQASDTETKFEGTAYVPIQVASKNEDYKSQILDAAMAELREWKQRYSDYKQFFESVFNAIEELEVA